MNVYDIVFVGHVTIDEIVAIEGSARGVPGGAPLFGALAAAVSGKKIAVITRMAKDDEHFLEPLKKNHAPYTRSSGLQGTMPAPILHKRGSESKRRRYGRRQP